MFAILFHHIDTETQRAAVPRKRNSWRNDVGRQITISIVNLSIRGPFLFVLFLMLPGIAVGQSNETTGQPAEGSSPKRYLKIGKGMVPPKVVFDPKPLDPISCKIKHEAVAVLWVAVGEQGTVDAVKVERSAGHDLDQKAIDAVKQWKFEPATKDGTPVPVHVDVQVSFHLC